MADTEELGAAPGLHITDWIALGRVVYCWTDRRDAAVDRNWWRTQGGRVYRPTVHEAQKMEDGKVPHVAGALVSQQSMAFVRDATRSGIPGR